MGVLLYNVLAMIFFLSVFFVACGRACDSRHLFDVTIFSFPSRIEPMYNCFSDAEHRVKHRTSVPNGLNEFAIEFYVDAFLLSCL